MFQNAERDSRIGQGNLYLFECDVCGDISADQQRGMSGADHFSGALFQQMFLLPEAAAAELKCLAGLE